MKERVLDFKVYLPQLEEDPGKFKGGVKRYPLQKNEDSPGLLLGTSFIISQRISESNSVSPNINHLGRVKKNMQSLSPSHLSYGVKIGKSPVKFGINDPIRNNMLELMQHPAFKQPVFTKQQPKVNISNPILGYSGHSPKNQEKKNNLMGYGTRIVGNDRRSP